MCCLAAHCQRECYQIGLCYLTTKYQKKFRFAVGQFCVVGKLHVVGQHFLLHYLISLSDKIMLYANIFSGGFMLKGQCHEIFDPRFFHQTIPLEKVHVRKRKY
jgi:hypothetical protein